jgi:aminocarboxymuconate-semialdehyde decarboxylase
LVGFPLDTTLAAAQLIFAGVLDRFPRLRICLGQAGGFFPYIIGRLDAGYHARPECRRNIQRPPSDYLQHFYYDTIIHSAHSSAFLIDTVGPDRVMFGTDFPFDMNATSPVAEIETQQALTAVKRTRIYHGTAAEFLRLPTNAGEKANLRVTEASGRADGPGQSDPPVSPVRGHARVERSIRPGP